MKKVLFPLVAFAILALGAATVAGARGPDNEFATGSAKSDIAIVGLEHVRFSAHNTAPATPTTCPAKGQIQYSTPTMELTADVTHLVVRPNLLTPDGGRAFIGGTVTRSNTVAVPVGSLVWLDVADSGMNPAGTGDQVRFQFNVFAVQCFTPIAGHPIDQGNIIVNVD